LLFIKIIACCQ